VTALFYTRRRFTNCPHSKFIVVAGVLEYFLEHITTSFAIIISLRQTRGVIKSDTLSKKNSTELWYHNISLNFTDAFHCISKMLRWYR